MSCSKKYSLGCNSSYQFKQECIILLKLPLGFSLLLLKNDWKKRDSSDWKSPGFKQSDQHPVTCVNWLDAQAFVTWMNTLGSRRYRLSTEAEWEYAARSGGKKERFAGFSDKAHLFKYANFCDSNCETSWNTAAQNDDYKGTSPVGYYRLMNVNYFYRLFNAEAKRHSDVSGQKCLSVLVRQGSDGVLLRRQ